MATPEAASAAPNAVVQWDPINFAEAPAANQAGIEVAWADRWAELENAAAALQAERDHLSKDLEDVRRQKVEQAIASATASDRGAAEDGKELKELRAQLQGARGQADQRLSEVVEERRRAAQLSDELRARTAHAAALSGEKLRLQRERAAAERELAPVRAARDRLQREKAEAERLLEELKEELTTLDDERGRHLREAADLKTKLSEGVGAARADAAFHQQVAQEALEAQRAAWERAAEAERRLREAGEDSAADRAALEGRLALQAASIERCESALSTAREQLAQALEDKEAAEQARADAARDASTQAARADGLSEEKARLEEEHERLLRRCTPGAESGRLPEGFTSLTRLAKEHGAALEEAQKERQAKEQLQEVLQDVEREVRARYPALLGQKRESERLRALSQHLSRENESLLARVRAGDAAAQGAESRAKRAERSAQILEAHARDVTAQLAIFAREGRQQRGTPFRLAVDPGGDAAEEAARTSAAKRLAEENSELRLKMRRLDADREMEAQKELKELREEHDAQVEEWKEHLAERADQMKALGEAVERVGRERDEAQRALAQLQKKAPAAEAAAGVLHDGDGADPGTAAHEEVARRAEAMRAQLREARAAEREAQQALALTQGRSEVAAMEARRLQGELRQTRQQLEERQSRLLSQESRVASLERAQREERAASRARDAELAEARAERARLEVGSNQERERAAALEACVGALEAEKAAHAQRAGDLQAQLLRECDRHRAAERDLEASREREKDLLEEQLEALRRQEEVACFAAEEARAAGAASGVEAAEVRARASQLEATVATLEDRLSHVLATGTAGAGADGLEDPRAAADAGGGAASSGQQAVRLEQKLRHTEEREVEQRRGAELWKGLASKHEADLRAAREEVGTLRGERDAQLKQQAALEERAHEACQQREQLEARVQALSQEASELRAALDAKSKEVAAAMREVEKKAQEVGSQRQAAERESAGARSAVDEWQHRHQEAVAAHASARAELAALRAERDELATEASQLRRRADDLGDEACRARGERAEEIAALEQRLQGAQQRAVALVEEAKRYQEHLLTLAQLQTAQEGAPETAERIAAEMRRAREASEVKLQEAELEQARLGREAVALRREAMELRQRCDEGQRRALQLEGELRRERNAVARLAQMELVEQDNHRLTAQVHALEARVLELGSREEERRLRAGPLEREVVELRDKEHEWDKAKRELQARAEESRKLHEELLAKLQAHDVRQLKRLEEEAARTQAHRAELHSRVEKLQEELKQRSLEASGAQALRKEREDMQRRLAESNRHVEYLTKLKAQLEDSVSKKEQNIKNVEALKELRDRKISEMEEEHGRRVAELTQERDRLRQQAPKQPSESASAIRQADEDLKLAQQRADRALALAADYQRAIEALLARSGEPQTARARPLPQAGASTPAPAASLGPTAPALAPTFVSGAAASVAPPPPEAAAAKGPTTAAVAGQQASAPGAASGAPANSASIKRKASVMAAMQTTGSSPAIAGQLGDASASQPASRGQAGAPPADLQAERPAKLSRQASGASTATSSGTKASAPSGTTPQMGAATVATDGGAAATASDASTALPPAAKRAPVAAARAAPAAPPAGVLAPTGSLREHSSADAAGSVERPPVPPPERGGPLSAGLADTAAAPAATASGSGFAAVAAVGAAAATAAGGMIVDLDEEDDVGRPSRPACAPPPR